MTARAGGRVRVALLTAAVLAATGGSVAWQQRAQTAGTTRLPRPAGPVFAGRAGIAQPTGRVDPCGLTLGPHTQGVRHAQLPCGVKLYVTYGGTTVLTNVVDQGATGRDAFDLTPALAGLLGIHGTATVQWRFAR